MYYIQMAGLQPKLLLWIQLDLLLMMEKKKKTAENHNIDAKNSLCDRAIIFFFFC